MNRESFITNLIIPINYFQISDQKKKLLPKLKMVIKLKTNTKIKIN